LILFQARRLPFYLTFASMVAVLCSNSASNCLIGAAMAALLVYHFRFGDELRFPPVKLPLGLFFVATSISVALSGHIREAWPGPRKFSASTAWSGRVSRCHYPAPIHCISQRQGLH
jgi:hypothetical protein